MQDMTGYVLPDIISQPLDEQLDLNNSTAQTENDFYVQNPGLQSPEEFVLGDHSEYVLSDDSNMFDNSNYNTLDSNTKEYLPKSPLKCKLHNYEDTDNIKYNTIMIDEERDIPLHTNSFGLYKAKVKQEKPRYLAIIDSEEPFIKEEPEFLYSTQTKSEIDMKTNIEGSDVFYYDHMNIREDIDKEYCSTDFKDLGIAGEVVVMTEGEDKFKTNISLLDSVPSDTEEELEIPEETVKKEEEESVVFQSDPFTDLELAMDEWFNDIDTIASEFLSSNSNRSESPATNSLYISSLQPPLSSEILTKPPSASPESRHVPQLTLDITAAKSALLVDKELSDTPELLEALKPAAGQFDLIKFITTNSDPNNNAISPSTDSCPKKAEELRKGKSHLSLVDLKQAQKYGRGKPLSKTEERIKETSEPSPSTSGISNRPARKSATRFKKMIEDGFLSSVLDNQSVSSDDEDEDGPKAKRRRTTSTSSTRRRFNSDSDRSSVCEDAMKYRERRDRNNLSSKRSRQKRKMQHQMKQKELKELEEENRRLRHKADELESVLKKVKAAWAEYLAHLRDNDKD